MVPRIINCGFMVCSELRKLSNHLGVASYAVRKARTAVFSGKCAKGDNHAKDNSCRPRRFAGRCTDSTNGRRRRASRQSKAGTRARGRAVSKQQCLCGASPCCGPAGLVTVQRGNIGARWPLISNISRRKGPGISGAFFRGLAAHRAARLTPRWRGQNPRRSRAAGPSSGRACRWRRFCHRSTPPPARTRWRW
jgi:hypothetical protein